MTNHYTDRDGSRQRSHRFAIFAIVGLLPLGMGARGCEHAIVGDACKADAGTSTNPKCARGCLYDGKRYAVGDAFMASDGCNQCSCSEDGQPECTLLGCSGGATCGGLQAAKCKPDEYCDFAKDAQCGAADQTGMCKAKPEVCRDIYQPVCGCDDKTYGNACEAAAAGVSVARDAECRPAQAGSGGSGGSGSGGKAGSGAGGSGAAGGCDYNGKHYNAGDTFKDADGCNSCSCGKDALVACTLRACAPVGVCGGLLGGQCAKGQYCSYPPDASCGAADATGKCMEIPSACTKEYKPVCGCDGKTYGNACTAAMAGVSVASDGECGTNPGKGCDYNGVHYAAGASFQASDGCNKCTCSADGSVACTEIACPAGATCGGIAGLACKKGEYCNFPSSANCGAADQTGKCSPMPQACTQQYDPVCGCDDKTYGNACSAASAGVSVAHTGECGAGGCTYNGKHYNAGDGFPSTDGCNKCSCQQDGKVLCTLVACSAKTCGGFAGFTCDGPNEYCNYPLDAMCGIADASGTCAPVPQVCDAIYQPVCGCDGKTYSSECNAAMKGTGIRMRGACK